MTALPPGRDFRDLRGSRPDTSGLTWRFVGICLPVVFIAYFAGVAVVRAVFLALPDSMRPYTPIGYLLVLVPMSVALLRPFMLRQMGSSKQEEKREQVWARSHDMSNLALRQAGRYLAVAFPVELLGMLTAGVSVAFVFNSLGFFGT